jgi:tRNA A37 threonylcarbamoyladenosine synthetase subunit TsaC/SUA5/YrdC
VAVRVPDHDFLRGLLRETGVLAVTSANRHGAPTPRAPADVAAALGPEVRLVVDDGVLREVPSTLVNVAGPTPVVEREGAVPRGAIAEVLGGAT